MATDSGARRRNHETPSYACDIRLGRVKPSMNEQFKAALGAVYHEINVLSQVSENESSSVDFDMTRLLCGLKTIPK